MANNSQLSRAAMLAGPAKLSAVTTLVEKLTQDLVSANLPPDERDAALEELKIYGRDPRHADPIFTKEGIEMLTKHALDSSSATTSRNALRCLCNALLLKTECRQSFVDLGYDAKVCNKLKNDSRDDEFLASRLIFLTTYDTNANLEKLINEYDLAGSVVQNLERHAKHHSDEQPTTNPMQDMALTETLKLLFNVTHHCQQKVSLFTPAIPHIVTILCKDPFQLEKPLDPPTGPLVNALLNLDLLDKEIQPSLYPPVNSTALSDRLIELIDKSRTKYQDEELDSIVTPLIGVLRVIHEIAPQDVRVSIRERLLPTEADRQEILGRSTSLPSWILTNSTNTLAPKFANTVSAMLFEFSDKDASTFVDNVGYGFASGYLYNNQIPLPQNASNVPDDESARPVNPITGQFLDLEAQPDIPEMTEAEREQEAERLFVLFQRLQANGVISVENPMRRAVEEGRFEELPDDHKEEAD